MAKTPCYKTSIFLAETAKSHIGVCNKLFQSSRFFNYHRTQRKITKIDLLGGGPTTLTCL